jgi:serine/threonine protein kinase
MFGDYEINVSESDEKSTNWRSDGVRKAIYHRVEDEFFIFVKSIPYSKSFCHSRMKTDLENLINIRHPCIACPIGFISRLESEIGDELKIVGLYLEGLSLANVISVCPIWWTPTMKAKAIVSIVLGLRFVHSFGLVHGHLTSKKIVFDFNDCIEIVDFETMFLDFLEMEGKGESDGRGEEEIQLGGFLRSRWRPEMDLHAFALILFEIVFGHPAQNETSISTGIPTFVSMIIESGLSSTSTPRYS